MENHYSLLLLDNEGLARLLSDGEYRFTNLNFEEAKAILEMKGQADTVRCFNNLELEHVMYEYLGITDCQFPYASVNQMYIGQEAIALKLYITPSGTQPIVLGENYQEAKKINNIYIYCQHVVRLK